LTIILFNAQIERNKNGIRNFGISYILALCKPATGAGDIVLFEEQREKFLQMVKKSQCVIGS
jgi:hypothetical protein